MDRTKLHVTLSPSFPHFKQFVLDERVDGVRFNTAGISLAETEKELAILATVVNDIPRSKVWIDVKGRQPRVVKVHLDPERLIVTLNHPIVVDLAAEPIVVTFKAGADSGVLDRLEEDGRRLVFKPGGYSPFYTVHPGESLHIRHPSFDIITQNGIFTELEKEKIRTAVKTGITRFYLSFVWRQEDADELRAVAGCDLEINLKIEDEKGLDFVRSGFHKRRDETLMLARGDLYASIKRPMDILQAYRLLIGKDPEAYVGSRLLLSTVNDVPACTDLSELAWLYDLGFRNLLLCDELCVKGSLLEVAVNVVEEFRQKYST